MDRNARIAFIRAHTRIGAPPLCPELPLHLADEVLEIWQALETVEARQLEPPFWAFAWPGGQALARFVLDHPEVARGKRVLDFASGGGVSALACVRAGARQVCAAEIDPWATAAIELNLDGAAQLEIFEGDRVGSDAGWEVVLAGDVCYRQEPSARIEAWLRTLARRGARVLLGDPGRGFMPKTGLRELARFEVATPFDLEGVSSRSPAVWEVLSDR
jgi:predicted nicotinamide N-methyase